MTEICWIACHVYMLFLTAAAFAAMGFENAFIDKFTNHRVYFMCFWALANGPFAFSVVLMKNALVLHDLPNIAVTFIHLTPSSLAWTFRWYSPQVLAMFPGIFNLPQPDDMTATFKDVFMPGFYFYSVWFVLYMIYSFIWGRHCGTPYSHYETCFILQMKGAPPVAKMLGYDGSTAETHARFGPFVKYMLALCVGCLGVMAFTYVLWFSFWAHTTFVLTLFLFCTWNGAIRYFNMMTKYYVSSLKGLANVEGEAQPEIGRAHV